MREDAILAKLAEHGAVLTNQHFVYTSGLHGSAYINMRAAAHDAMLMDDIACGMAVGVGKHNADVILGPESLGRTLSPIIGSYVFTNPPAIWCEIVGELDSRHAEFSPKFNFGRFITPGTRVVIVDDLLTTGSSIKLVADFVRSLGGIPVAAVVAARRTPDVTAYDCGTEELEVLAEVDGFVTYTPEQCREVGPCSRQVPMVLRPGHGHEWIKLNAGYPAAD